LNEGSADQLPALVKSNEQLPPRFPIRRQCPDLWGQPLSIVSNAVRRLAEEQSSVGNVVPLRLDTPASMIHLDEKSFYLTVRFVQGMRKTPMFPPILRAASVTIFVLICLAIVPVAQAQASGITSITDVQSSSQAVLQNGVARAMVAFTVYYNYYYNPQGYLVFGIYDASTSSLVKGSAVASPTPCQSLAGTSYTDSAVCTVVPATPSGTESASFTLTFNSPQQYSLNIRSFIWDTRNLQSGTQVSGSTNSWSLTISVTGQTVSTSSTTASSAIASFTATSSTITSSSNTAITSAVASATSSSSISTSMSSSTSNEQPFANYTEPLIVVVLIAAVAVAIIIIVSRRRTTRPASTKKREATPKPSGSFCSNCGARLPEGDTFCGECGQKQE
jgi:hypothetical protein